MSNESTAVAAANIGAIYGTTNIGLDDWGVIAGATVEYALTDVFTAGINYSHQFYRNFDGTLIDADLDTVTLRVGARF